MGIISSYILAASSTKFTSLVFFREYSLSIVTVNSFQWFVQRREQRREPFIYIKLIYLSVKLSTVSILLIYSKLLLRTISTWLIDGFSSFPKIGNYFDYFKRFYEIPIKRRKREGNICIGSTVINIWI